MADPGPVVFSTWFSLCLDSAVLLSRVIRALLSRVSVARSSNQVPVKEAVELMKQQSQLLQTKQPSRTQRTKQPSLPQLKKQVLVNAARLEFFQQLGEADSPNSLGYLSSCVSVDVGNEDPLSCVSVDIRDNDPPPLCLSVSVGDGNSFPTCLLVGVWDDGPPPSCLSTGVGDIDPHSDTSPAVATSLVDPKPLVALLFVVSSSALSMVICYLLLNSSCLCILCGCICYFGFHRYIICCSLITVSILCGLAL